jgi:carbamoyltransferase
MARDIRQTTGQKNLCLAGGVALNCVANGKLLREKIFDQIWIQPAAGDAGGAIGAALCAYYIMLNKPRVVGSTDSMKGAYLGPAYAQSDIERRLHESGAVFSIVADHELISKTAFALAEGKALGWHQGRMEFGPRALGARSIIADPRSPYAQKQLNLKIKFRESFRPFAPSILREDISDWFELDVDSPYMLMVANVTNNRRLQISESEATLSGISKLSIKRSEIPAVTHVDYSARIQTVHAETNPLYHALITEFKLRTGCPILVNTSFNVRGEPIVNTPEEAFRCFMGTDIDVLVIGNCILYKEQQMLSAKHHYANSFSPD